MPLRRARFSVLSHFGGSLQHLAEPKRFAAFLRTLFRKIENRSRYVSDCRKAISRRGANAAERRYVVSGPVRVRRSLSHDQHVRQLRRIFRRGYTNPEWRQESPVRIVRRCLHRDCRCITPGFGKEISLTMPARTEVKIGGL